MNYMSYIVMVKYSGKTFMTTVKTSSRKSAKACGIVKASGVISLGIFGTSHILLPPAKIYKGHPMPHSHKFILGNAKKLGAVVSATPCPGATPLPRPGFVIL